LTERQRKFIEAYLISGNATQAYKDAYGATDAVSNANGARLLANASISAEIAKARDQRSKRTEITADAVLKELWENAQLARQDKDYNASNKALELCDKHLGALTDRLHVTTDKTQAAQELADLLGISVEDVLMSYSGDRLVS
jgi:hypothetical protein